MSPTTGCRRLSSPPPPSTPTRPVSRVWRRPASPPAAAPRPAAQELFEQAAKLADEPEDRADALRFAAELALHRWRGDETLRLLQESDRASRRRPAPPARPPAPTRASSRWSRGWAGSPACSRARRSRRCWSAAAIWSRRTISSPGRGWCSTRRGSPGASATMTTWRSPHGRASSSRGRRTTSRSCPARSTPARRSPGARAGSADAVAATRERIELLSEAHGGLQLGPERSDSLHMMIESLVATGDYRGGGEVRDAGA